MADIPGQAENFSVGVIAGSTDLHLVSLIGVARTNAMFADAAIALADNLHARGLNVRLEQNVIARAGRNYVFGVHGLTQSTRVDFMSSDSVVVNSEPLANLSQVLGYLALEPYLAFLRRYRVWDYSLRNVAWLKQNIAEQARLSWVPLPFSRAHTPVVAATVQDIDVLFYGRVNDRRRVVLDQCTALGLNVVALEQGFHGSAREEWLARSKVVLNLGWVDDSVFEQYRVSYLLNRAKAVVTEMSAEEALPDAYRQALAIDRYENLAARCRSLVDNPRERLELKRLGAAALQNPTFVAALDRALAGP
jgi:hypothetical protein